MYEELIESSRACAMGYNGNCDRCLFCGMSNDKDGDCYQQLHKAAADAIEGLSGLIDHYGGETGIKNLQEYASKYWDTLEKIPRWIPVTERLPEEHKDVLAIAQWKDNHEVTICYGRKYKTRWYLLSEPGELLKGFDVTHWMPLPEPPKEE